MRNILISFKLWIMILLSLAGLLIITVLSLEEYHASLMEEKVFKTKSLVESAHSILAALHEQVSNGEISKQEAQTAARAQVRNLRYEGNNYFWINDESARIVMHPIKPELETKDLSDFTDPTGKHIFIAFANMSKTQGEGVVDYYWPKPGREEPVQKISYVKGFKPWGWVVGTGVYVDDVERAFWSHAIILCLVAGVMTAILLIFATVIRRSIVIPINRTTTALNDISMGDGDLTRRLDESGRDEISKLSAAFNRFSDKIQDIVTKVSQVAAQLAAASEQLSSTTNQAHEHISQQDLETQSVATAINQMVATVKEIASSAEDAANSARDADSQATSGKEVVLDVTSAITSLSDEMASAMDMMNQLARESENIGSVLDVIREIAEQTSLLALNAAIEAARAGEQGRGFAVVADEVRSLSNRTQEATSEIRDMIERLQAETNNAVKVINSSAEATTLTVGKAKLAAQSLDQVVSSVMQISQRNIQIAGASEEQSAVAAEIDRSVVHISDLAKHTSEASEQIAIATQELSNLGENLREMISHFKIA